MATEPQNLASLLAGRRVSNISRERLKGFNVIGDVRAEVGHPIGQADHRIAVVRGPCYFMLSLGMGALNPSLILFTLTFSQFLVNSQ